MADWSSPEGCPAADGCDLAVSLAHLPNHARRSAHQAIKLRGDPCWLDLTCLQYHYETQPIPNPVSWYLHQMPAWFHTGGVLANHLAELAAAWFVFGPRRVRHIAGIVLCGFQIMLIISGNLSFLNWLTLIPCLACFDDSWLQFLFLRKTRSRWRTSADVGGSKI